MGLTLGSDPESLDEWALHCAGCCLKQVLTKPAQEPGREGRPLQDRLMQDDVKDRTKNCPKKGGSYLRGSPFLSTIAQEKAPMGRDFLTLSSDTYHHPEVDRIWLIQGMYYGSFKDHIPPAPGWL